MGRRSSQASSAELYINSFIHHFNIFTFNLLYLIAMSKDKDDDFDDDLGDNDDD